MAYIVEPDIVKYACTCGLLKPITKLYFCRHCLQLRCGFCVCHEVDSLFCGKCLENLPSNEARLKKNKCSNCLDCPKCFQQLTSRAATTGTKASSEDPKGTPRKVVYLLCLSCKWSTRDVGIPDQPVGNSSWPERENVNINRLQEIQELYKGIVLADKQQKMERDKKKTKKYMSLTDRTGTTAAMLRKRLGLPDTPHPLVKSQPKPPEKATAKEEVDELPFELLMKPINLNEITSIEQRLFLPDWQPTTVDKLYPSHKQLSVKRSLRCRACEHNVSKPEYNPISIKFKIQLFAYYHIPEIRVFTVEPLRAGKVSELLIKFINPTQHQTVITLFPLDYVEKIEETEKDEEVKGESLPTETKEPLSLPSLSAPNSLTSLRHMLPSITVSPRNIDQEVGADVEIPTSGFTISPRDDAAEYDETFEVPNVQDDPKLVVHRKSNKVVIRLKVTPKDLNLGDEVFIGFTMQHIYTNTIISTVENKAPQKYNHQIKVFLNLGKLVGSE